MKRITLLFIFALGSIAVMQAQPNWSFKGTVIKMRMAGCSAQHGFLSAMSGAAPPAADGCPEYTIVGEKVVYVVVGRRTEEFMPLDENVEFQVRKNELMIGSDEKVKWRFEIEQMTLRSEWEQKEACENLPRK